MASSDRSLPSGVSADEDAQTLVHISLNCPRGGFNNLCNVLLCILYGCDNFEKKQKQSCEGSNIFKSLKNQKFEACHLFSAMLTFHLEKKIFQIRMCVPIKQQDFKASCHLIEFNQNA